MMSKKMKSQDCMKQETIKRDRYGLQTCRHTSSQSCQVFTGKILLWLSYQSIGVIYGDIGTSPLYVFSSTFTAAPSYDDLVGVLSLIIWSLIMMVTIKYILIVLRADNEGEGGTFSCYSLLSRYVSVYCGTFNNVSN
jgi:K+ transporter